MSLGIYTLKGHLLRTLQSGKKLQAGEYDVTWDGMDESGSLVGSGNYQLKGINCDIKATSVMVVGNPGNPTYKTSDGTGGWNSFWGNPVAMTSDGTSLYILFNGEEGDGNLLKVSYDGKVQWKEHLYQFSIGLAVATDGKYVYVASDAAVEKSSEAAGIRKSILWRVSADKGDYVLWDNQSLDVGSSFQSGPLPFWERAHGHHDTLPAMDGMNGGANVRGLAVKDGKAYVSLYREDKIEVWDPKAGKKVSEITNIPKPQGLAFDAQGRLHAVSNHQIVCISEKGIPETVIDTHLSAPFGLAIDPKGNLFVSDLGDSQQIKKFSPKGRLLWASGRKGGRAFSGKWDPDGFLFPAGLTVDPSGRTYVPEDAPPRRIATLDGSGKRIAEWIGTNGLGAGNACVADDADPTQVYAGTCEAVYCGWDCPLIRYKIDYEKKTWKTDAVWWGGACSGGGPRATSMDKDNPRRIDWGAGNLYIRHFQGHSFLICADMMQPIYRIEGDRLIPSVCIGKGGEFQLPVDLNQGYTVDEKGAPVTRKGRRNFIWRDKNGDGLASTDEVEFSDKPAGMTLTPSDGYVDESMNFYLADPQGAGNVYKLPCQGLDEKGNPIYFWDKAELVMDRSTATLIKVDRSKYKPGGWVPRDAPVFKLAVNDGCIYGATWIEGENPGIGWASKTMDVKFAKWDENRKLVWKTGKKAHGFAKPGETYGGRAQGVDGIIKGFVSFTDMMGRSHMYSTDEGLFVADIPASDAARGEIAGPDAINVELLFAKLYTNKQNGKDYWMAGDESGLHIYQLDGLDSVERLKVPVQVTESGSTQVEKPKPGTVGGGSFSTPESGHSGVSNSDIPGKWEIVVDPGNAANLYSVAFGNESNGVAVGESGTPPIYTTDGGESWQQSRINPAIPHASSLEALLDHQPQSESKSDPAMSQISSYHLFSVCFSNPKTAWVGGIADLRGGIRRGLLMNSSDAGASWSVMPLPEFIASKFLFRCWFDDKGNGWLISSGSYQIFCTTDGGKTWKDLMFSMTPLAGHPKGWAHRGFYAFNADHLWIGGEDGHLFETTNGGVKWTLREIGSPKFLIESIYFLNEKNGWAVGNSGMIAHTIDGGETWQVRDLGIRNRLMSVKFISEQIGFIAGPAYYETGPFAKALGVMLATEDGGKNWKNISPTSASLRDVFFLDPKHGWVVGGGGGSATEPKVMVLRYMP